MEKSIWRRLGMGEHASRNASEPDWASLGRRRWPVCRLGGSPIPVGKQQASTRRAFRGGWGQRAWKDRSRSLGGPTGRERERPTPGGKNITGGAALKGVGAGPYERGSGVMPAEQRGLTETCICGADGHCSQHQRPSSTLPGGGLKPDEKTPPVKTGGATAEACCRYTVVLPRTRLTHTAAPPPDLPWRPAAPARSRPAGLRTPTRLPRPRASPDLARPRRIEGYP